MIESHSSTRERLQLALTCVAVALSFGAVASIFGIATPTTVNNAYAHEDPSGCTENQVGGSIARFRGILFNVNIGGGVVIDGEEIAYRGTLFSADNLDNCAFAGGLVNIVLPNATSETIADENAGTTEEYVKCLGGTTDEATTPAVLGDCDPRTLNQQFVELVQYEVDCSDDGQNPPNDNIDGALRATLDYSNGLSHEATSNTRGVGANIPATNPCKVPSVNITKTVTPDVSKVGDEVTYTIEVCNDGQTSVTQVEVMDSILGDISALFSDSLAANTCESVDIDYIIQETDPDPLPNTANVTGYPNINGIVFNGTLFTEISLFAEDSAEVDLVQPSFTFEKDCAPEEVTPGGDIQFTIFFNNTGNVPLNVTIVDTMGSIDENHAVGVGENVTITFNVTTTEPGTVNNTATAHVNLNVSESIAAHLTNTYDAEAEAECEAVGEPDIRITKDVTPTVSKIGDNVTYTIFIENNGTLPLENVVVLDSLVGDLSGDFPDTLAVGENATHTYNFTIPTGSPDPLVNTANVTADVTGESTQEVFAEDSAEVDLVHPSWILTKDCEPTTVNVGEDLMFTIYFENLGDVALNVTLVDTMGSIDENHAVQPGENVTITYNVTTTEPGTVNNTVTAFINLKVDESIAAHLDNTYEDSASSECEVAGFEGCTPGYWKVPQHHDSWTAPYDPTDRVDTVFTGASSQLADDTLVQALSYNGGGGLLGAERILLRAAVAAVLNSASADVDYPLTTAQVIAQVNAALASDDRPTILALAAQLDANNNLGCDLN